MPVIISASRRTDIPALYSDWFFNRISAGFAYVRNPMNPRQVSRIPLNPEVVDGIVFWTKNPGPMMGRLEELRDYTIIFSSPSPPTGRILKKTFRIKTGSCQFSASYLPESEKSGSSGATTPY